jgi:hypothetical protein
LKEVGTFDFVNTGSFLDLLGNQVPTFVQSIKKVYSLSLTLSEETYDDFKQIQVIFVLHRLTEFTKGDPIFKKIISCWNLEGSKVMKMQRSNKLPTNFLKEYIIVN